MSDEFCPGGAVVEIDYKAAHVIAEDIDGLPENARMWHELANRIVDAALGIGDSDEAA
jgi:hypothetical protein